MRINPIGLSFGNLKPDKVKKNNSKITSNPVEGSYNLAKLSLEQLQGMNDTSFRGDNDEFNEIRKIIFELNLQNGEIYSSQEKINKAIFDIAAIINSLLLKTDKNGQTFFHKATGEDLEARKQEITPQLLKIALPMQDNHGYTCFHYKKDPKFVKVVSDILGDETPEVFAKTLTLKSNNGETFLHNKQYPETLKMYVKALEERAPEVFEKILPSIWRSGLLETPIDRIIKQNNLYELETVLEALGNKAADFIRNYRKFNQTIFYTPIKPEAAKIIIKFLGDKAPEILNEMLPMQNNFGKTFLHFRKDPEVIKIYARALKDKAPEVFEKIYTTQDNFKKSPADILDEDLKELIQAIIEGKEV